MANSMTAFGRFSHRVDGVEWICEVRSVNHRYLEQTFRLPEAMRDIEMDARKLVKHYFYRGKIDLVLKRQAEEGSVSLSMNQPLLAALIKEGNEVVLQNPQVSQWNVAELFRWPGMLMEPGFEQGDREAALTCINGALNDCLAQREREGEALVEFVKERIAGLLEIVEDLVPLVDSAVEALRTKLLKRLEGEAGVQADRLEQELVIHAQKWDIHEELGRLTEHSRSALSFLDEEGAIGRRLDFLSQELNREANTIASKSNQIKMTQLAVEMKVLIEQIREQVQNIE